MFLENALIEPMPIPTEHLATSRVVWRHFGKGRHSAALNYGDSFAYALADVECEPLLCKDGEFARTDIEAPLRPSREPSR